MSRNGAGIPLDRPIILCETMRSVMYLPFYLAAVRGDWQRAGMDISITASPTPADAPQAVLDGRADVYFGGPMRVLMHHDADRDSPLVCFGQVVAGDPFILIGREPNPGFGLKDLLQKRVAVASEAPTPWLTLQDDLRRAGIAPTALDRAPDLPMADNLAQLTAGSVDVVQVFEPFADQALHAGQGHIWHRFAIRGPIGFSTFVTTRRFSIVHRDVCRSLIRGVAAAQKALFAQSPAATAAQVAHFLPDIAPDALARIIGGYRSSGVWAKTPQLPVQDLVRLKAAMLSGGQTATDTPYDRVVDGELCEAAGTMT